MTPDFVWIHRGCYTDENLIWMCFICRDPTLDYQFTYVDLTLAKDCIDQGPYPTFWLWKEDTLNDLTTILSIVISNNWHILLWKSYPMICIRIDVCWYNLKEGIWRFFIAWFTPNLTVLAYFDNFLWIIALKAIEKIDSTGILNNSHILLMKYYSQIYR